MRFGSVIFNCFACVRSLVAAAWVVLIFLSCPTCAAAAEPMDSPVPSRTVWGHDLGDRPVRAVFLAPYGAQHDSFELMQRFDIDGRVLTMSSMDIHGYINWGFRVVGHYWPDLNLSEDIVRSNIRAALATDWEAVVMSGTPPWYRYPPDMRQTILEKVAAGRGMMIGGLEDALRKDIEQMGLKLEETKIGAGRFPFRVGENGGYQGHARVYQLGKGRLIHFYATNRPPRGFILSASVRQSDYEMSAARAAWYLLRAARPGEPTFVTKTRHDEGRIIVELDGADELRGGSVQLTVHRRDTYETVFVGEGKVKAGRPVVISLPQVAGGEHHAEVRVMDRAKTTVDWDVIRFNVPWAAQLRLALEPEEATVVKAGETLRVGLEVKGETAGLEVVAQWFDHWGRLLISTAPQPLAEQIELTVPAGSLSVINHLNVMLQSKLGPVAVARAELLIRENVRPADFHMLYWKHDVESRYEADSWRRRRQWDVLRRDAAADSWANGMPYVNEARDAALSHLRTVPYTSSFHATTLAKELLNDQWIATAEQAGRETARAYRPYNPLAHTLGDENSVSFKPEGRFADTPQAWAKFRTFLRGVYADLGALNAQWETEFAAWEDIRFDNEQQMLPSMDNPSAWVDYRDFVTHHFVEGHRRVRQAIREEDPDAWVGFDGMSQYSSYGGIDWWEICRDMEFVNMYHTAYVVDEKQPWKIFNGEAIGSFSGGTAMRGCWLNAADRDFGGAYVPWYLLLNGWNSAWWWQATFLHPANGPLRWDLGLTPVAGAVADAVQQIKRGPGTLLAHAEKQVSPIAVHYSAANWHASTIESGVANHVGNLGIGVAFWEAPSVAARIYKDEKMKQIWGGIKPKGHYAVASANVYTLLHDLGFEPRTIARQQIEAGGLLTSGVRVLILPFVVSLSNREVQQIRQYVTGGGMIIADYHCGLRDGHGRRRSTPALDDVFGIERESFEVRRGRAGVTADMAGGLRFESVFHDPVRPAAAETRAYHDDGTQAFFTHHHSGGDHDTFGWYRMRLTTPAEFAGKKLYLVFEAVDEDAHIYINGRKAFEHSCDTTGLIPDDIWNQPFVADVSKFLRPGEQDLLAVGVYNRHGMGGIHKAVAMVAADTQLDLETAQAQVRSGVNVVALSDWRFALDENNEGIAEQWYAEDYDADAWPTMRTDLYTGWQGQGFSGGKAAYLNTDLYGYIDLRRRGRERRLRQAFAELLVEQAHLRAPFVIKRQHGSAVGRTEVTRFGDGETTYYGVLPSFDVDDKSARQVVLPFGDGVHVYDVRAQKYLGPGGPIADTLYPGQARMYAALPYAVEGVSVVPAKRARQGEPVEIAIRIRAQGQELGPHAVRIQVLRPDGSKPEYLTRTLYLAQGQGAWSFVPALNSLPGRWAVTVVEAVSGATAAAHFDVSNGR